MTIKVISEVLNVFVPTGIVVVLLWWSGAEGWPYWKARDIENREREYNRDLAQIAAQNAQSEALTALARAVDTCPLKSDNSRNMSGNQKGQG